MGRLTIHIMCSTYRLSGSTTVPGRAAPPVSIRSAGRPGRPARRSSLWRAAEVAVAWRSQGRGQAGPAWPGPRTELVGEDSQESIVESPGFVFSSFLMPVDFREVFFQM